MYKRNILRTVNFGAIARTKCLFVIFNVLFGCVVSRVQSADFIYVSLLDNTIATFDVSLSDATSVSNSKQVFASSFLNGPHGLVFDGSGNLYVANVNDSTVSKFNPSGVYQPGGSISTNVNQPTGLAIDSAGNLYVSNYNGNSISKFDTLGAYQAAGSISTNLSNPHGLAFDSLGNLFAANFGDSTLSKFNSSGVYQPLGSFSSGSPVGLAFDGSGNLSVANYSANTVSKYSQSGSYISAISTGMNAPNGIAFDGSGNLYVANSGDSTISKYNSDGEFQFSWATGASPRYLAFNVVPEPSSWILGMMALMIVLIGRLRQIKGQSFQQCGLAGILKNNSA